MAHILNLCRWLESLQWATTLRESQFAFPVIEGAHLLGLAFIMGPVLMLDFRLVGLAWRDQPVSKVAQTFVPYSLGGAVVMFVTGIVLFCAEAVKCYQSGWFRIKVILLAAAGINALYFHTKTQSTWRAWDDRVVLPASARAAGIISLVVWAGVLLAGRWTAYTL
jgi:uncharacterized membrane protein